ncbi:MAG: Asp-tRNA(Asn)/Glu-tRNA(Gln) amidotransferase subunit GatA [Ruminococcaceae bacterium]|nr:Asp-tRNA(Asn)/Glu-tRNA(Gln) amidotransferase subunit GatA [Oscillospiraceae bacterium]
MQPYELTIHESAELLRDKKISSRELTQSVLDRINAVEDRVSSYITVDADAALACADKADARIAAGEAGPLTGIPAAIKDNICTKDVATTCASKMLENFVPPYDAFVSKRLKDAGAVLVGKANMDEFAMGSSTETSYFKKTRNPYNLDRVPGGSSGGSAAAVAADEAIFALGSDTGGSVRQPASFCSVVGLKPTYGLVSRYGLVAFASSLDQIGPITKDVTDCATVLNAIAGHDAMDSTSVKMDLPDYCSGLNAGVKGKHIGVPTSYLTGARDDVRKCVENAIAVYRSLGAEVEECDLSSTDYALPAYYIISSAEASSNLARFDGVKYGYRTENFDSLTELYCNTRAEGFGSEVKRRIMLGTYALSSGYYDAYYKKALQARTLIKRNFDEAFAKFDALLTPAYPTTAFSVGEKANNPVEMYAGDLCTVSVNIAGLPAIVLPGGFGTDGMPIGIQLIGNAFSEQTLLGTAYALEQNTDAHTVRPTL